MFKKVVLLIGIFVCLGLGTYFTYFHRPPTTDILAANMDDNDEECARKDDGSCDYDHNEKASPAKESVRRWNRWVKLNNYVSIGKLYNKCNGTDRIMIGRVIMLPDELNGGVTSRTYLNVTFDKTVTGGRMFLTCQYNGNQIYSNKWDLCTVEENEADRIIVCPIRRGPRRFVKELKIPNYLPKGRYTTMAWLMNQDTDMIGCAFASFSI